MIRCLILGLLCIACCVCISAPKAPSAWNHSASPYRAFFEVKSRGSVEKAGVVVSVPLCGQGEADGGNVFCFDQRGRPLNSCALGKGTRNCALVQVQVKADTTGVLAYFGSRQRVKRGPSAIAPLMCSVYSLPRGSAKSWQDVSEQLEKAEHLGSLLIRSMEQMCNPVDSRDQFILVMSGVLNVKSETTRHYFIATDDAGYLFVDDTLRISRNGIHSVWDSMRGENRQEIHLEAGLHPIKVVGVNIEKTFTAALGQWYSTPKVALVSPFDFVRSGESALLSVEARMKDSNPVFMYDIPAYMPVGKLQLTQVNFRNCAGLDTEWVFDDGVRLKGAAVSRVFGSLETRRVKTRTGRATAEGMVMFPQNAPPKQLFADSRADYKAMEALMPPEFFKGCNNLDELNAFLVFFLRTDLHPTQAAVAKAILAQPGIKGKVRIDALLALARSSALEHPDRTLRAYDALLRLRGLPRERCADVLSEAVEFALFRMRDFQVARKMIARNASRLPKNGKALTAMQFDLALQSGELENARKLFQKLLEGRTDAMERRVAAAQGSSIQARVNMMLEQGRILDAEAAMREWVAASPQDRGNGSFSLQRARCFLKRGWTDGAIGELTAAIQSNPLLPNLPDVENALALAYSAKGDKARARELWEKITKDYPNHPLAAEAAGRLK